MSVISDEYFQLLLSKSSDYHGVAAYGQITQPGHNQLLNRTSLLFALECLLFQHRQDHATPWSPLTGKEALVHLILQKYKWPLSEIRGLSLQDSVLLLQEELRFENLPEEAAQVIRSHGANKKQHFPSLNDDEWDPDFYLQIPKQQHW
ncbi:hypothetical protein [Atlantibacter sp.]|uniref:ECs1072 family phage-associated protein n=1 Tax=Atlantibacter sp. TaxID=1903473 RepID=UPI00289B1236|nr:hypothetical protein [Atlantibacter sp.]